MECYGNDYWNYLTGGESSYFDFRIENMQILIEYLHIFIILCADNGRIYTEEDIRILKEKYERDVQKVSCG